MLLQVHESFMVTRCCDLKKVQMFMQHALFKGGDGVGDLHILLLCQHPMKLPSAYAGGEAGRRVESAGSRAWRHGYLMSKVVCRAQTNKPCWGCAGSA